MNDLFTPVVWNNLYDDSWKGLIVDDAFAHPAKVARGLVRRIYDYLFERGWLQAGGIVVDPFGGIGGCGLDAMQRGCHFIGCELEPKFVELAGRNVALWESHGMPGTARIVQGDSRRLCEYVGPVLADVCVSSPPFAETIGHDGGKEHLPKIGNFGANYGNSPGQLGAMKPGDVDAVIGADCTMSQPTAGGGPCADRVRSVGTDGDCFGNSPGQLSAMKPGSVDAVVRDGNLSGLAAGSVDSVISSPPFMDAEGFRDRCQEVGQPSVHHGGDGKGGTLKPTGRAGSMGSTPGNLASLAAGDVAAIVSSPPFRDPSHGRNTPQGYDTEYWSQNQAGGIGNHCGNRDQFASTDNLHALRSDETFWSAARIIVSQCLQILKPGGVAVFVCKDFIRKGQRVPFSQDWKRLCESCGFELVEWIKASLIKKTRHPGLFGEDAVQTKSRKSFFRRLAERKGSPEINEEDVLVMRKPE